MGGERDSGQRDRCPELSPRAKKGMFDFFQKVEGVVSVLLTWDLPVNEARKGKVMAGSICSTCLAELPFRSVLPDFSSFSFLSLVNIGTGSNSGRENQRLKLT